LLFAEETDLKIPAPFQKLARFYRRTDFARLASALAIVKLVVEIYKEIWSK
jgi:hypothetical protein